MQPVNEAVLRQNLPVFINSFNQPTYTKDTVDWFFENGFQNLTVMDNRSKSVTLQQYFSSSDFFRKARLVKLRRNLGPRRAISHVIRKIGAKTAFIFTDPDLVLPTPIAPDFLTRLFEYGTKYNRQKVGLALDISEPESFRDLTLSNRHGGSVGIVEWESPNWENQLEDNVYAAGIDTTFFLYVPPTHYKIPTLKQYGTRQPKVPALRVGGPGFVARHRPWYIDDGLTEQERNFYLGSCSKMASWARNR